MGREIEETGDRDREEWPGGWQWKNALMGKWEQAVCGGGRGCVFAQARIHRETARELQEQRRRRADVGDHSRLDPPSPPHTLRDAWGMPLGQAVRCAGGEGVPRSLLRRPRPSQNPQTVSGGHFGSWWPREGRREACSLWPSLVVWLPRASRAQERSGRRWGKEGGASITQGPRPSCPFCQS